MSIWSVLVNRDVTAFTHDGRGRQNLDNVIRSKPAIERKKLMLAIKTGRSMICHDKPTLSSEIHSAAHWHNSTGNHSGLIRR